MNVLRGGFQNGSRNDKKNVWVTASGGRLRHADVWRKTHVWLVKFAAVEDCGVGSLEIMHVKAHSGIAGNESADRLETRGVKLLCDTMVNSQPRGWFRNMVETHWSNSI